MSLLLATALSALVPQEPPAPRQPAAGPAFEVFPLQPFVAAPEGLSPPPYGTLLTVHGPGDDVDLLGKVDAPQFVADQVVHCLQVLHPQEQEQGQLRVSSDDAQLFVAADAPLLEQVRGELRALAELIGRPIEIDAAVYALDEPPPAAVADAATAASVLAGRAPLWHAAARTRSNVRVALDQTRWSRYVARVDVSVAEKSSLANAVVDAFCEGVSVAIEPHALVNSEDVVLFVQFALGQRRRVDNVATGVPGHPNVDLPQLETAYGCASARVPANGALFVTLAGDAQCGCRFVLALQPRYPTPRARDQIGRLAVLPVSALTSPALTQNPMPSPVPLLGGETADLQMGQDRSLGYGRIPPDQLLGLLEAGIGSAPEGSLQPAGGYVFVGAGPDAAGRATAMLQALQDRLLRTFELRCRIDLEQTDGPGPFAAAIAGGKPRLWHEVALPSLPGRTALLFRGLERRILSCVTGAIANEATAMNSVVESLPAGLFARFCPTPTPQGVASNLVVQFQEQSEPELRNLAPAGMVMLVQTSSSRLLRNEPMPPGKDLVLGQGPVLTLGGSSWRSTAVARISGP